jgi:alpha-galactosidase
MPGTTKVVLMGAGSYVFTPSTLHDLLCDHRLPGLSLWLVDPDVELAGLMAGVAHRMAESSGLDIETHCQADRRAALPGADFVTTSVAIDGARRWQTDRTVAEKHGVIEPLGELGGVGGLSYTLRQVPLLLSICRDMEELCPEAILLNVSNPLPRVMTAIAHVSRIRAYGLCNAAFSGAEGFENLARWLGRPMDSFTVFSAGTNHFNWLLEIRDAESGTDLYPILREAVGRLGPGAMPVTMRCLRDYDRLALSGDSHIAEFLPYDPSVMKRGSGAFHGTPEERQRRREDLALMASGDKPWEALLEHRAWERPADIIEAMVTGRPRELAMLNIPNHGVWPAMPDDAVVEVPCAVEGGRIMGHTVGPVPERLTELLVTTARVNTMAARAAATADHELLHECIDTDRAITEKEGAHRAIDELITTHADLLPEWVAV